MIHLEHGQHTGSACGLVVAGGICGGWWQQDGTLNHPGWTLGRVDAQARGQTRARAQRLPRAGRAGRHLGRVPPAPSRREPRSAGDAEPIVNNFP